MSPKDHYAAFAASIARTQLKQANLSAREIHEHYMQCSERLADSSCPCATINLRLAELALPPTLCAGGLEDKWSSPQKVDVTW